MKYRKYTVYEPNIDQYEMCVFLQENGFVREGHSYDRNYRRINHLRREEYMKVFGYDGITGIEYIFDNTEIVGSMSFAGGPQIKTIPGSRFEKILEEFLEQKQNQ